MVRKTQIAPAPIVVAASSNLESTASIAKRIERTTS
jgi:hypothetical protein